MCFFVVFGNSSILVEREDGQTVAQFSLDEDGEAAARRFIAAL